MLSIEHKNFIIPCKIDWENCIAVSKSTMEFWKNLEKNIGWDTLIVYPLLLFPCNLIKWELLNK